ncbi:unnamed protein product [Rotaria magnacalcarata]|uniref:Uncharacterized protein n=1 Tax=Rotaria magnacalcarata TaxID=392030 RepID=A0A8S3DKR4_9BILA|nr:unnamed protein product [Rotaria magnacalcarata]CAF5045063.1 unnamed protein product [Rotaria magnacalcarata]CAF5059577.1 unnamed protein product [Rotaria magnacalcarata]
MDAAIDQFIMLNPSRLSQIVERVQGITNGNTFVSSDLYSCSREKHRHCVQPRGIYSSTMNNAYWIIPGIHVGCSIVETLLNSTLESLWGGLTLSFGFLAPCFVKLLFKINAYSKETRVNIVA